MKKNVQPAWLSAALEYAQGWIGFQLERHRLAGCSVAIARGESVVREFAFGAADLRTHAALTPRHRFRIASHSKTFTASGLMLLREQGRIGLDDPVGRYVTGLHKELANARVGELMSHGAGVTRDGEDAGQFSDRRPYLSRDELKAALARKQPLPPGLQLKYSNHGYGLLGLLIEEVTGTDYATWITRHVIEAAGLKETVPDMAHLRKQAPMASGHSAEFPFGQRLVVPGDNICDGIAPAAGFVSTASDVARFFAQLAPDSKESILSAASRRDMTQRRWRDGRNVLESHYGLGTMMSGPGPKEWFGHTGSLQGFVSRTARFTASGFTITVLCNSQDGFAYPWVDGIASILAAFEQNGAPSKRVAPWGGRWWNMWGAADLVPMGDVLVHVAPGLPLPFDGANTESVVTGKDNGLIRKTSGYHSAGEKLRMVRDRKGKPAELWVGGSMLQPKQAMLDEATQRYKTTKPEPVSRR
jgi:D-alanyl-D-alanine carboxypeptidase